MEAGGEPPSPSAATAGATADTGDRVVQATCPPHSSSNDGRSDGVGGRGGGGGGGSGGDGGGGEDEAAFLWQ